MADRNLRLVVLASLGVLAATVATACQKGEPTPSEASHLDSATVAASSNRAAQPKGERREKAYSAPPASQLGTRPDGVGVPVGATAPDFEVRDIDGRATKLSTLNQRGALLLSFYRGGWCPYCSFEIHALTKAYPEFEKRGVTPVAISVDRPEEGSRAKATYEIPFPVLSDPDLVAHGAYRVVHKADAAETERLTSFGIDLEKASGRSHHSFAIPAFFLIDKDGRVRWAHADPDYKVRPSIEQLLAVIDERGSAR